MERKIRVSKMDALNIYWLREFWRFIKI